jgi:hypothetical protein
MSSEKCGDRGLAADCRRLAGDEASLCFDERGTAIVEIEQDRRPQPTIGVGVDDPDMRDLERVPLGTSGPHHALDHDPVPDRTDELGRDSEPRQRGVAR